MRAAGHARGHGDGLGAGGGGVRQGPAAPRAYLFANKRATRLKVLVHDGIGVWLAARRLNAGRFVWAQDGGQVGLSREQLDALVPGLPWRRLGEAGIIRVI